MAVDAGLEATGQVLQGVDPLLPAGRHHREHPLDEPAAPLTGRPAARLAPQDGVPQRPLRRVVRRLDPPDPEECPQVLLAFQQAPARRRRLVAGARRTPAQSLLDAPPDRPGVAEKRAPGHRAVPVLVPPVEQPVAPSKTFSGWGT